MQKIGDLEINQDLNFERRSWKVERVAWVIAALILVAALLGFLGPGPLGKATAASPDKSISLDYYRVVRRESPVTYRVKVHGRLAKNGALRLWLDRKFVEALEIKHVDPTPDVVEIDGERFVYRFKTAEAPATIQIFFHVEPNKSGNAPARLGVVDGPEIQFKQFYLP
jgi:hypothetical protein